MGLRILEDRLNSIAKGSLDQADMTISLSKTKILQVEAQEVGEASGAELLKECKFTCPHLSCGFKFKTKRGMMIHAGRCQWKNEFEVDRLLACEGHICARKYLVRWKGHGAEEDRWIARSGIHPELIKEFEQTNGLYVEDWPHRCDVCDLPCQNAVGVKIHKSKAHKGAKKQNFKGSLASNAVKNKKLEKLQETRDIVTLQGKQLENVTLFKYLGSLFAANGLQQRDIKARIARAMTR